MFKTHLFLLFLIMAALFTGCGDGSSNVPPPPPPKSEFLYVLAATGSPPLVTNELFNLTFDPVTGALGPLETTNFSSSFIPGFAVSSSAKNLYVSDVQSTVNSIDIYAVDPATGKPSFTSGFSLTVICPFCPPPSGPGALTFSPNGKYLYYGSSSFGSASQGIGALTVDGTMGSLGMVSGSPFPADQVPFVVIAHPSGRFIYTENLPTTGSILNIQSFSAFAVDSVSGALTPVLGSPFIPPLNTQLGAIAINPSGKYLYATTGSAANGVLGWSIDSATGALTPLPGSPFLSGTETSGLVFDSSGKFLYVTGGTTGGIFGLSLDSSSGQLTSLPGSPFAATTASSVVIDKTGRYLFAADPKNTALVGFTIDSLTGSLSSAGAPVPLGAHPTSMAIVEAP